MADEAYDDEYSSEDAPQQQQQAQSKRGRRGGKRKTYEQSLKEMLYGFGDVREPDEATVSVMAEIAVDYMTQMTRKGMRINGRPGKVETQDVVFLIRRDAKKVDRVRELLRARQAIQAAKKLSEGSVAAPPN